MSAAAFDLDAALAGPAAAPKGGQDAAGGAAAPNIDAVMATDDAVKNAARRKALTILRRALTRMDEGEAADGARLAMEALELDDEFAPANHVMGLALDRLGRLSHALTFYERAYQRDPNNVELYHNLGLVAWKLDMLPAAETFNRLALEMDPGRGDATINLAGVLRDQGKFEDAIELLRVAIYGEQTNHALWNALGVAVLERGSPAEAEPFLTECIRLAPEWARGWHNYAYALSTAGRNAEALPAYDKALVNPATPEDRARIAHGQALSTIAAGDLPNGWIRHECRLDPAFEGATLHILDKPRWDGVSSLAGKRLLVLGEQGLGDEVMFSNVLGDLIEAVGPDGSVKLACERRLTTIMERSFPGLAQVDMHATVEREGREIRGVTWVENEDYDLWTPIATALIAHRPSVEAFPKSRGHLTPAPDRLEEMRSALAALPAGLKVGVCWKSMLMTAKRTKYFSPFERWKGLLQTPGVTFVSMQYGDVGDEIERAEDEFGVEIHEIDGLDLKDDLDGVMALGASLDLVIGPMNASTNLAAAAGGAAWIITTKEHWPMLGTPGLPWYPQARCFWPDEFGDWDTVMDTVAAELATVATAA